MAKKTAKTEAATVNGAGKKASKSMWKGTLSFGIMAFPIKLYTAAREERESFNLICREHKARVRVPKVCTKGGEELTPQQLMKGYCYDKAANKFVFFEESELDSLAPESTKQAEIVKFIPAAQLDPLWLEKSYFFKPNTNLKDGGAVIAPKLYALLRAVLVKTGKYAVAKVSMTQKEHLVVIRPVGTDGLAMHTLFYQDEVRACDFDSCADLVSESEVELAEQLVNAQAGDFNPAEFEDGYRKAVGQAIDAKIKGDEVVLPEAKPAAAPVVDLMAQLKASVAAASKKAA